MAGLLKRKHRKQRTAKPTPTPIPTKDRPSSKMLYDDDMTIINNPTIKPIAATKNVVRRPYRSVKHWARNAPKTMFHTRIRQILFYVSCRCIHMYFT
jgi:hypothetical protein